MYKEIQETGEKEGPTMSDEEKLEAVSVKYHTQFKMKLHHFQTSLVKV